MHAVDDIGQHDSHGGMGDPNALDEESRLKFLIDKNALDPRTDHRLSRIGYLEVSGDGFEMRLLAMHLRGKALLFHKASFAFEQYDVFAQTS
ncbi:hypothetical protein predicted by Glimmer/Critica [Acetobacter senegalensis]|uniref:Uncharacterized protein n=1 Tax=Acetobacter senegalensis TaxID=446692 RepID=A0A0U5BED9_9PROT|nr:hypothetical protein predicted by Glimmer/Critica [Acetobacter senegalensis]